MLRERSSTASSEYGSDDGSVGRGPPPRGGSPPRADATAARRAGRRRRGDSDDGDDGSDAGAAAAKRRSSGMTEEERRERRRRANRESARRMRVKKCEMLTGLQQDLQLAHARNEALLAENARLRALLCVAPPPPAEAGRGPGGEPSGAAGGSEPAAAPGLGRLLLAPKQQGLPAGASLAQLLSAPAPAPARPAATASGSHGAVAGSEGARLSGSSGQPREGPGTPRATYSPPAYLNAPSGVTAPSSAAAPSGAAPGAERPAPGPAPAPSAQAGALARHGALAAAAFSLSPWPHTAAGGLPAPSAAPSAPPVLGAPLSGASHSSVAGPLRPSSAHGLQPPAPAPGPAPAPAGPVFLPRLAAPPQPVTSVGSAPAFAPAQGNAGFRPWPSPVLPAGPGPAPAPPSSAAAAAPPAATAPPAGEAPEPPPAGAWPGAPASPGGFFRGDDDIAAFLTDCLGPPPPECPQRGAAAPAAGPWAMRGQAPAPAPAPHQQSPFLWPLPVAFAHPQACPPAFHPYQQLADPAWCPQRPAGAPAAPPASASALALPLQLDAQQQRAPAQARWAAPAWPAEAAARWPPPSPFFPAFGGAPDSGPGPLDFP
ncbi:hypothetical protein Rsub_08394 [Raphidocelis subcapitata]|uniref:BZIP domain-containing protein n=1 Tax=Raphidocelis subcapitata TaxID=307507 RepID=A0A2V0P911_9CHLO|nr:hypothetical protein Rsub_08394 [Raphidocelis subcapitata]|eukprot:GBF95432.1 hypothetical protein Rsub_08394 [Raphidocelis subcapitata]